MINIKVKLLIHKMDIMKVAGSA